MFTFEVHLIRGDNSRLTAQTHVATIDYPSRSMIVNIEPLHPHVEDDFRYRMSIQFPNHINQRVMYHVNVWCGDGELFLIRNIIDVDRNGWPEFKLDLRESLGVHARWHDQVHLRIFANVSVRPSMALVDYGPENAMDTTLDNPEASEFYQNNRRVELFDERTNQSFARGTALLWSIFVGFIAFSMNRVRR
eukprot:CCRYP_008063-RA/>CCRYP_008063-RA protein AED:0.42 eAED:0.42 QI:0/-1/0/1/-1/1/1/0/190